MSEHTRLPWAVWNANRGLILGGRDQQGDETIVACVRGASPHTPQDGAYVPKRAEAEANAELIVRAVNAHDELVAALKEARACVESWGAYAGDYFRDKHGLADDLAAIDAAIAKATGHA